MKKLNLKEVNQKIRTLMCHVGALQGSYPKVLKTPDLARAHLVLLREVMPYLVHILKFAAEMVPLSNKVLGMASKGSSHLGHVSKNLRNINNTAEMAVTEILSALDEVEDKLEGIREVAGEEATEAIDEASMQLTAVMSALQFQDITAQQIEATNALLATLGDGLQALVGNLGVDLEGPDIEVREGTYDVEASYDRDRAEAKQREIDEILEAGQDEDVGEEEEDEVEEVDEMEEVEEDEMEEEEEIVLENEDQEVEEGGTAAANGGGAVSQEDIDALIEGN